MSMSRTTGGSILRLALARQVVASTSTSSHLPLVARANVRSSIANTHSRALSTSRILALAQPHKPLTGPTQLHSQPDPQGPVLDSATLTAQSAQAMESRYPEAMTTYPDYSKGPSALDKASQLFFFTEILRGTSVGTESQAWIC